jgi:hypothetical protein
VAVRRITVELNERRSAVGAGFEGSFLRRFRGEEVAQALVGLTVGAWFAVKVVRELLS